MTNTPEEQFVAQQVQRSIYCIKKRFSEHHVEAYSVSKSDTEDGDAILKDVLQKVVIEALRHGEQRGYECGVEDGKAREREEVKIELEKSLQQTHSHENFIEHWSKCGYCGAERALANLLSLLTTPPESGEQEEVDEHEKLKADIGKHLYDNLTPEQRQFIIDTEGSIYLGKKYTEEEITDVVRKSKGEQEETNTYKWSWDAVANAGYLKLSNHAIESTVPLTGSVKLDKDVDGKVVGVEILGGEQEETGESGEKTRIFMRLQKYADGIEVTLLSESHKQRMFVSNDGLEQIEHGTLLEITEFINSLRRGGEK